MSTALAAFLFNNSIHCYWEKKRAFLGKKIGRSKFSYKNELLSLRWINWIKAIPALKSQCLKYHPNTAPIYWNESENLFIPTRYQHKKVTLSGYDHFCFTITNKISCINAAVTKNERTRKTIPHSKLSILAEIASGDSSLVVFKKSVGIVKTFHGGLEIVNNDSSLLMIHFNSPTKVKNA